MDDELFEILCSELRALEREISQLEGCLSGDDHTKRLKTAKIKRSWELCHQLAPMMDNEDSACMAEYLGLDPDWIKAGADSHKHWTEENIR